MNNDISIKDFIDLIFTSYYNESGAYAAGIIDKETAIDNFDKHSESVLHEMDRYSKLLLLSADHIETVCAMKSRLLRAIEQLP